MVTHSDLGNEFPFRYRESVGVGVRARLPVGPVLNELLFYSCMLFIVGQ